MVRVIFHEDVSRSRVHVGGRFELSHICKHLWEFELFLSGWYVGFRKPYDFYPFIEVFMPT
jgi:hypothetical protein